MPGVLVLAPVGAETSRKRPASASGSADAPRASALACAGEDNVWSSCPYAQAIVKRRASQGLKTTLYTYPRASNWVGSAESAYEPGLMQGDISTPWSELGREDLWPRVISFIRNPR